MLLFGNGDASLLTKHVMVGVVGPGEDRGPLGSPAWAPASRARDCVAKKFVRTLRSERVCLIATSKVGGCCVCSLLEFICIVRTTPKCKKMDNTENKNGSGNMAAIDG